jgi:hypothetical protein
MGPSYLDCFKRYWKWTQTDDYKQAMREIVHAPDFLAGNYLSTDARIPVTLLRTNVCSPLATNALKDNIWDNFSSQTYKALPSVGTVTIYDPFTGDPMPYEMPAGGRGYTRVPSLIALWSSGPYLLNNTVGPFDIDPSVAARMGVFDASIEQLLWPEKREHDAILGALVPGTIDRTLVRSQIRIPEGYVPDSIKPVQGIVQRWLPWLMASDGDVVLGPIPEGTPVGLLSNLRLRAESRNPLEVAAHLKAMGKLAIRLKHSLKSAPAGATDAELRGHFAALKDPMLALSKCPDLVVNRGHYFGTTAFNQQATLSDDEKAFGIEPEQSDADRRALIAFLKTF